MCSKVIKCGIVKKNVLSSYFETGGRKTAENNFSCNSNNEWCTWETGNFLQTICTGRQSTINTGNLSSLTCNDVTKLFTSVGKHCLSFTFKATMCVCWGGI